MTCPLCGTTNFSLFCTDKLRSYYRCPVCDLIFVPDEDLPCFDEEKSRYLLHQNSADDRGYIEFLSKSFLPLLFVTSMEDRILDFGSGPNPVLAKLLTPFFSSVDIYDPVFHDDTSVFNRSYNAVISTEVVEHVKNLGSTLDKVWSIINSGGWLILQTSLHSGINDFKSWSYKNDITHIRFFSEKTCLWLKEKLSASLSFSEANVIIYRKL